MEQRIITDYAGLDDWLLSSGAAKLMLVCDKFLEQHDIVRHFLTLGPRIGVSLFTDFTPNPQYESVVDGVRRFHAEGCSAIVAVGGGSAMDVAKCIKLYSGMDPERNYLEQTIVPNDIPFLAVPTTAGTGSEATRFAVIYYQGVKQSVADLSCIPAAVFLDSGLLKTLPEYQKKSTMMDAFCHAMESLWSVNSTEESQTYSFDAIRTILAHMDGYLANTEEGRRNMLLAANTAGKAINITQTTAGHAMCYKLTSLYGCAHGHAAFLCNRVLLPWTIRHTDACIDPRGKQYLTDALQKIALAMGCDCPEAAADKLNALFEKLALPVPQAAPEDYAILCGSVNPVRLKNYPIRLSEEDINTLYHSILR